MIPAPATRTFVLTVGIEPITAPPHPRSSAVCVPPDPQDGARETYPSPDAVVYDRSIFPVPAQGSAPMTDTMNSVTAPEVGDGHIIRRTFMMGAAAIILAGCVPGVSGSGSTPSPTWNMRMSADTISIDVPAGWVRDSSEDYITPLYIVQEGHQNTHNAPGIRANYMSPGVYLSITSPPPMPDLEVGRHRDSFMNSSTKTGHVTDAEVLPDRTIGGSPAYGYTGIFTFDDGIRRPAQQWLVWREDGMWIIRVTGFESETAIPPELLDALDTITWTIPAPTTAPATSTATPS